MNEIKAKTVYAIVRTDNGFLFDKSIRETKRSCERQFMHEYPHCIVGSLFKAVRFKMTPVLPKKSQKKAEVSR